MREVIIRGEGGQIILDVNGYERPSLTGGSDANWLSGSVKIDVGAFNGQYCASFTTQDFVHFAGGLGTLHKNLAGEAVFNPEEEAIFIKMIGNGRGQVIIEVHARVSGEVQINFEARIVSDQTYLIGLIHDVGSVLRDFPQKGT